MAAGGTADGMPAPHAGERRKRRRHHRNKRMKRRWRIAMYVAIHLLYIVILIFLWLKIVG
jgi:cell division septal protein FtsQ